MRASIRLLGGFEVVVDGATVPEQAWRRRAAAALVKLLALQPGRRLRREQVLDALWPDLLTDEAAPRLHTAAHYARTALGSRDAVVLASDAVTLLPGAEVIVDVHEFDSAADAVVLDQSPAAAAAAAERYQGDVLPADLYEPWASEARAARRRRYLELLRAAGRWHQLAAAEPLDEQAQLEVAREHVVAGRRSAALRRLTDMEEVFDRELGVGLGTAASALRREALALPSEAAVAAAPVPWATTLPSPSTPTIGRDRDLERVLDLLEHTRILTLLGPGGVGKTRLAIEAARRRSERSSLEACFVDLTRVRRADQVAELVLAEIGARHAGDGYPERAVVEALRGRSMLLVLDNFEHVVDAAVLVSHLVAKAPGLQVVCTSRARLRIAGEQVFDVAPLPFTAPARSAGERAPLPPAVALFEQAATAVDPDFRLGPHLADVVAICRSVDGLPLAIELAAGHVRTLSPAQLRARLGARLGSPGAGTRDSHPRQRTIPATIDWSLQLLGPAEQRLFPRLGVFAGAVAIEAIEAVCGEDGDVVEALSRLVDQSLVRRVSGRTGEPRFRLLTLLRERARQLLPDDAGNTLRCRHAAHVTAVLEDLDECTWGGTGPWLDRINDLMPEIRLAHADAERRGDWRTAARITAALGGYWHREGHHIEGRAWALEALAHQDGLDDLLAARLHIAAGLVVWTRDGTAARQHWVTAAGLCLRLRSDRYLAYSLALAALTYVGDDDAYPTAMRLCDGGVALARTVGEATLIAQALNIRGELARLHGDDALALTAYEEGKEFAAVAGDETHRSMFLANLGYLAVHKGDYVEAHRLKREALSVSWSVGRRMMAAWYLSELAAPELRLGRPEHAAVLVGAADQALRALGATRTPGDRPEHERVLRALDDRLGGRSLEKLRAEGARLSLDAAVALALSGDPASAPREGPGRPPTDRVRAIPKPRSGPVLQPAASGAC